MPTQQPNSQQYLAAVIDIAMAAGDAIMQVYATAFTVETKADQSPLTEADCAAHNVIVAGLERLTPHIPVLSEESEAISYEVRQSWTRYWLIDPLDGTREFVKRNGEFTVNIALIDGNRPVLGVVYAPVTGLLYFATHGNGAFKKIKSGIATPIHTQSTHSQPPILAVSRSHSDENVQRFMQNIMQRFGQMPELIRMGSSLKICLVAEGLADNFKPVEHTNDDNIDDNFKLVFRQPIRRL